MTPIKLHASPQKMLRRVLLIALLIAGIWYASWQARFLIAGPEVTVEDGMATLQNERVVVLRGQAHNVTDLYLNGRPIAIDEAGEFAEGVVLENGYTIVSLDASDRYGRPVHWEKSLVYVEKTGEVVQR